MLRHHRPRESHHGQPGGWERTTCTRNMSSVSLLVILVEPSLQCRTDHRVRGSLRSKTTPRAERPSKTTKRTRAAIRDRMVAPLRNACRTRSATVSADAVMRRDNLRLNFDLTGESVNIRIGAILSHRDVVRFFHTQDLGRVSLAKGIANMSGHHDGEQDAQKLEVVIVCAEHFHDDLCQEGDLLAPHGRDELQSRVCAYQLIQHIALSSPTCI